MYQQTMEEVNHIFCVLLLPAILLSTAAWQGIDKKHTVFRRIAHPDVKYQIRAVRRTWHEASDRCENKGGHLAIIDDTQENDFLKDILVAGGGPNDLFWFGANDEVTEGDWYWIDGSQMEPWGWMVGQPNNPGEQDCAGIVPTDGWKSNPCLNEYKFICELYK